MTSLPPLSDLRAALGLSGRALARLTGTPRSTMGQYLTGTRPVDPALHRLVWLAATLPGVREALERA